MKCDDQIRKLRFFAKTHLPAPVVTAYRKWEDFVSRIMSQLDHFAWQVRRSLTCFFNRVHIDRTTVVASLLDECWFDYRTDTYPKDRRMRILDEKGVYGMSTENVRFLLNEIVRRYAKGGTYLEIGTLHGCSLLSAALYNESTRCIGIDNFSQFNSDEMNERMLQENLAKFSSPANIEFYNADYKNALPKLCANEPLKIDVYFYDGEHSYASQTDGLRVILPYLAADGIILVDDINGRQTERANRDFLRDHPEFRSSLRILTKRNCSDDWWNGVEVIQGPRS